MVILLNFGATGDVTQQFFSGCIVAYSSWWISWTWDLKLVEWPFKWTKILYWSSETNLIHFKLHYMLKPIIVIIDRRPMLLWMSEQCGRGGRWDGAPMGVWHRRGKGKKCPTDGDKWWMNNICPPPLAQQSLWRLRSALHLNLTGKHFCAAVISFAHSVPHVTLTKGKE